MVTDARACTPQDVGAVLAVLRADEERVAGRASRLVEGDVRDMWRTADLASGSWLLTGPGSPDPTGVAWIEREGAELGVAFPVAPDGDPGTFAALLDLVEGRAAELGLARLHVAVLVPHPAAADLLSRNGYRAVRSFYEMAVELAGPPAAGTVPDGFTLQPATPEQAPAFHETLGEAFRDHWEHHPMPFEEWWRLRSSDPDFDISWWFTVQQGTRTVAAIRTVPGRSGGVYVASLGVRRDWRGQGLAKALLQHTFARAWQAGLPRITLGVDAASPTGATALYRSVGMTVELESEVWEKHLLPAGTDAPAP